LDESSFLRPNQTSGSYGTLPARQTESPVSTKTFRTFRQRRNLPDLPGLNLPRVSSSNTINPSTPLSPSSFRGIPNPYFRTQRPISAYDTPLVPQTDSEDDLHARTNGIRVWYSSFASIDWLHDAIKDSVRFSRLRRGKSFRSRVRLLVDKSIGWIVVTLVGFFTAVVAFVIIRTEQWFFDLKEGYCRTGWTKAKHFCCPIEDVDGARAFYMGAAEKTCSTWKTWAEVFGFSEHGEYMVGYQAEIVQYVAYALIALLLASVSCMLTIYLTASTSFVTRKESGVLSPNFPVNDNKSTPQAVESKRKVLYYAAGSGIPEIKTILSGFVIHGYLGARVLITKAIGLALSVASGLSLGKEGPFVHIASCIGNIISRYVAKYENNEGKRRQILSAACAAGVAVAFGAPIGGTLFSLEEVSYFFPPKVMWRSFFCAMIAAITLKLLDPFGTGKLVLFQVTYDKDWHAYELIFFLLLGVFGGVYGAYFSKLNFRWSRNVRNKTWLKDHPISEVLVVTLVTTVLCFLNPYTRMGGTELVYELFAECRTGGNTHSGLCVLDPVWPLVRAILVAMVVKGALTVVTFGIRVPAGIFIPTLGVGACAGRLLGIGMQWLQWKYPDSRVFAACGGDMDCVVPGLYAMVGAAATLSGVTRTTVSLAVIMFELTDTLTYAVPIMLAVLVAKTVADALEPKGIYDLVIELSQLPYLDFKTEYVWGSYQINDVADRDVDVIRLDRDNTVETLRDQLQNILMSGHDDAGFPILSNAKEDGGARLVGYIGANELEHALSIVADDAHQEVLFHTAIYRDLTSSSVSSLIDTQMGADPFDFSVYMDQAPLTIQSNSPLELVHQFFVKLGARYVVVTDTDGDYEGIIDKKTWLAFLSELDERS
jgi:chloride channel 3/4/5